MAVNMDGVACRECDVLRVGKISKDVGMVIRKSIVV